MHCLTAAMAKNVLKIAWAEFLAKLREELGVGTIIATEMRLRLEEREASLRQSNRKGRLCAWKFITCVTSWPWLNTTASGVPLPLSIHPNRR
jgi:hypothetical protein